MLGTRGERIVYTQNRGNEGGKVINNGPNKHINSLFNDHGRVIVSNVEKMCAWKRKPLGLIRFGEIGCSAGVAKTGTELFLSWP